MDTQPRHIIPVSGKDSGATAIVQLARAPEKDYEFIFNDVGTELAETYQWLDKFEEELNIKIHRIGRSLTDLIEEHGILPSYKSRFCTRQGKIEPMEEFIGKGEKALIYYGLRADEPEREGYQKKNKKMQIIPVYPLREMDITINNVYKILSDRDLLPPTFFWQELCDIVVKKIDIDGVDEKYLREKLKPWVFNQLFAWRSRTNCYFCFYQRQYEWIGLLDHKPDLYEKATEISKETGGDDFGWRPDYTLDELAKRREEIIGKRAEKIAKLIHEALFQNKLFAQKIMQNDMLSFTSCGMFCGK